MPAIPRIRMFAGPNGSGKSTVKASLQKSAEWFGLYLNPDEIELSLRQTGRIETATFGLTFATDEIRKFLDESSLLASASPALSVEAISVTHDAILIPVQAQHPYLAAALTDFLRTRCLLERRSFTFETVMSHPDKIELFAQAKTLGYRRYLYYISTDDPSINIQRVQYRAATGGHFVDETKIVSRYQRSLDLLPEAIRQSERAFFFDTTGPDARYFANATGGTDLELLGGDLPEWFRKVWDKYQRT